MKRRIVGIFLIVLLIGPIFLTTTTTASGAKLELGEIYGGMRISTNITNTGDVNATDVIWTIEFKKVFPILGRAIMLKGGYIADLIPDIPAGETVRIGHDLFGIFGYGWFWIKIRAWSPNAELVEKTTLGRVFVYVVYIRHVFE